jgi:hypothetical protein
MVVNIVLRFSARRRWGRDNGVSGLIEPNR